MGGDFLLAENHPVIRVVENEGVFYLTKNNEKVKEALRKELALSTDRDKDSNLLYEINLLTRKASLRGNEFIRKTLDLPRVKKR
ncbi:hypothetical protein Barb6_02971 [Bacteroidales bacterium Barb6]|nr:hypothetical protein Barb6_02971 [Bacteroidales bacterium Barb6]